MRAGASTVLEDALEVDGAVEAQATVLEDINPVALVVARSVDNRDLW